MLDLDKKVGNRVCSNTLQYENFILQNEANNAQPYIFKLRTGCKNEPRRGHKFCETCTNKYSVEDDTTGELLFLESIHPLGNKCIGRVGGKQVDAFKKSPGEGWILVKLFGVRFKHYMKVEDLPPLARQKLDI